MKFTVNFDSNGCLLQTNGDAGDCAARTGDYYALLKLRDICGISNDEWPNNTGAAVAIKSLVGVKGFFLRYSSPPYNDPKDVSGDQYMPLLIASRLWGIESDFPLGRFPNGDLIGPQDYAAGIRSSGGRDTNIIEEFYDLQLIGSVALRNMQAITPDNVGDDIRLTLYILLSNIMGSSLPSRLATDLYKKRPNWRFNGGDRANPLNYTRIPGSGVQYAWDHYFDLSTNANPLNELARPLIFKYLRD